MSEALFVSCALVVGLDWRVVIALGVAMAFPVWAAVAVGVHVARTGKRSTTTSALFCQSVAREMRSGSSLRWAMAAAARSSDVLVLAQQLESGDAIDDLSGIIRDSFPEVGDELVAIAASAAVSGGATASLFDELGDLALMQVEMAEEVRVASAPVRASTAVLVGLPLAYLGFVLSTGRIQLLFAETAQRSFAAVGLVMIGAGLVTSYVMVARAR